MTEASQNDMTGVLRRVAKLLAIANDSRANPAEAAAAASQAEKIMRKFQLENADVIQAEMKNKPGAMAMKFAFAKMKRDDPKQKAAVKNPPWGQFLAVAIARLHDCEVRQGFDVNKFGQRCASMRFYGFHADVEMCVYTFDYLVGVLIAAVRHRQETVTKDRLASEAYRKGFVNELTRRLSDLQSDKEREVQLAVASRALVISKRQAIVESFGEFGYRETKGSTVKDYSAYQAGARDARNVDIERRGIAGASETTKRIA